MPDNSEPVIYQLKVVLQGISPMIWRRLLIASDSTIADLHHIIQIAMGWEDIHLHYFTIHGQRYGIERSGSITFNQKADLVKLSQFEFREKERFLYEYDLSISPVKGVWRYWWRHHIRVEAILAQKPNQTYPFCIGGKGICPPENIGGAWGFLEAKDEFSLLDILELVTSFLENLENKDWEIEKEEAAKLQTWLLVYKNQFDRKLVNERLQQYSQGNRESLGFEEKIG